MKVYFDIETNPINDWIHFNDLKEVKCMALSINGAKPEIVDIRDGLSILNGATKIIGHNIQGFDLPALKKLYPMFKYNEDAVFDTLIAARLLHANQRDVDFQTTNFPKEMVGSHSLKAWGHRLNVEKQEAPSFDVDSAELREYCKQDVNVVIALENHLNNHSAMPVAKTALDLEHQFSAIIREQERTGFPFNIRAAEKLHAELRKGMVDIEQQLQVVFPPKVIERVSEKTGKALKSKVEQFNPGSRLQIADRLIQKYGWKPEEFTPDGRPRVDEAVLSTLDWPEARLLNQYLTTLKHLGQLADGDEAWLKAVGSDGRLHGRVNTNGAITGRCTHSRPNMAQVPSKAEYRSLFIPAPGLKLVGVDASGLELRCLAHYLGKYDNGEYSKAILEGDIHWENAKAFGLIKDVAQDKGNPEHKAARNQAKGAIYALIYGAGNDKLGLVLGGDNKRGKKARTNFEAKVPAYTRLKDDVSTLIGTRGWLRGLDSRPLYPRSEHAALNTLLQSAGAVVMKQACVLAHMKFREQALHVEQVASVHDEYQFMVSPGQAEIVGNIVVCAIQQAGQNFDFRCPLDGEFRVGDSWAETH